MSDMNEQDYFERQRQKRKQSAAAQLKQDDNDATKLVEFEEELYKDKALTDDNPDSADLVDQQAKEQRQKRSKEATKRWNDLLDDMPDKYDTLTEKIDRRKGMMKKEEEKYQKELKQLREQKKNASPEEKRKIDSKIGQLTQKHTDNMKKLDQQIGDLTKKRADMKYITGHSYEDFTKANTAYQNYINKHTTANFNYNSWGDRSDKQKEKFEESSKKNNERQQKKDDKYKEKYDKRKTKQEAKAQKKQQKQESLKQKRTARATRTLEKLGANSNTAGNFANKLFTKSTGKGLFGGAKAKLLNGAKSVLGFILTHPILVVVFVLFCFWIGDTTNIDSPYDDPYSHISENTIEYNAWTDAFNDEQMAFFNQYRTTVSGTNLAPIIYTLKDDTKYQEVVQKWFGKLNKNDFKTEKGGECIAWQYKWGGGDASTAAVATKTCSKYSEDKELDSIEQLEAYLKAVYKGAVEEYIQDLNIYELRELFLKEVKYDYSYLYREWTDWTTQSPPKKIDTKQSSLEAEQSALTDEAYKHNEVVSLTSSVEIIKYKTETYYEEGEVENDYNYCVNKYSWSDKDGSPYKICRAGKHTGQIKKEREVSYSEWETITYYKYRDIVEGSEEWVKDYSKAEKNANRDTLNTAEELNYNALNKKTIEGSITENGITKEWESRYYDNSGVITKRIRYWDLYSFEDMVKLLMDEYYPETENTKYQGDQITLTANDDVYGTVYIPFDKTKIFREYYSGNRKIIKENYFTGDKKDNMKEGILFMKELLKNAFSYSGEFNPMPDFENTEAWRHSDEGGTNNFPYGQCTWFVYGLVYQNYGAEAAQYLNGNGNQMAGVAIDKSGGNYWTEGDISNGAIISFGVGSGGAGHVAMIYIDDNGDMWIAEGNLDGITNDWAGATQDYRITQQTPEQWTSWYGGSYQIAVPSGNTGSTSDVKKES